MTLPAGARRIREAFEAAGGRPLLVAYVLAGHPDPESATAAAEAALDAGADMLEVGVPFSDPVADGPVIAAAAQAAVVAGASLETAIDLVRVLRERGRRQPILAMGYLNPILSRGAEATVPALAAAGVDGLIVPDLPAAEDRHVERLVADAGLGVAFLVAPNTSPERLELAIAASTAFLYVVPLYGVTGARDRVADHAVPLLRRIRSRAAGRVPVAVGFGVSRPEHVRTLAPATDAIVVGSAIVSALGEGGAGAVGDLVASLATGLARPAARPTARRAPPAGRRGGSRPGPARPRLARPAPRR
jgi:tryptophan synthase alpha chain